MRFFCPLILLTTMVGPLHAYVDISPSLGFLIKDSTSITVLEVDKMSAERKVLIYKKAFDLKGVTSDSPVRHHIAGGFHPREPHIVMDWAEVGNRAVCFTTDKVSLVCIGTYWYQCSARADGWWAMTTGRPELALAYCGTALKLRRAIAEILEGKEVVITAINHGARSGVFQYSNVAFQKVLRGRDCPVWRIKASLTMPDSVWRVSAKDSPWIVGPGAAGIEDLPRLLKALESKGARSRAQAAEDLGLIGWRAREALPHLLKASEDPDPMVRVNAGFAMVLISEEMEPGLGVVVAGLKSDQPRVRREAAESLGDLGSLAKSAIPSLRAALKDPENGVRWVAIEALGRIGPLAESTVPALAEALKDPAVRVIAADALGGIGAAARSAVPLLVEGVKSQDADYRWTSAVALARIDAVAAKVALPLFVEKLQTGDLRMRWDALMYLTPMGLEAKEAADAIRPMVKRGNGVAAMTLATVAGPDAPDALPVLLHVLADDWDTTENIAAVGPAALKPLVELLDNPEKKHVHHLAIKALGLLAKTTPTAVPVVLTAFNRAESHVRQAGAAALGELPSLSESAVAALRKALADDIPAVRVAAAMALRKSRPADLGQAIRTLVELLAHNQSDVRRDAAVALGAFSTSARSALPALTKSLTDTEASVRTAAAGALLRIDSAQTTQEAVPVLTQTLRATDSRVRRDAAKYLGEIGREARDAVPALTLARQDDDDEVRRAAANALARIQAQ